MTWRWPRLEAETSLPVLVRRVNEGLLLLEKKLVQPEPAYTLRYASTVVVDVQGRIIAKAKIEATNGTAFTIANPIGSQLGGILILDIINSSGGALGTITFGTSYLLTQSFTAPANGQRRSITFYCDGMGSPGVPRWVEIARSEVGGGGAVNVPLVGKKASDQAINGATLVNVSDMAPAVSANTDYLFEFYVRYQSATAAVGIALAATVPSGDIVYMVDIPHQSDSGSAYWHGHGQSSGDQITSLNTPGSTNTPIMCRVHGIARIGGTGGALQLQAANETATNDITVLAGTMYRIQAVT